MNRFIIFGAFDPFSASEEQAVFSLRQKEKGAGQFVFVLLDSLSAFSQRQQLLNYALKDELADFAVLSIEEAEGKKLMEEGKKASEDQFFFPGQVNSLYPEESRLLLLGQEEEKKGFGGSEMRLPLKVLTFIIAHGLYFVPKARSYYKFRRYQHALRVAYTAEKIAEKNGLDSYKAFQAGYYHDITRLASPYKYARRAAKEYGRLFPEGKIPVQVLHQFTGPMLIEDVFGVKDPLILDAISCHTTGKGQMTWLDMILFASDKIEPGRKYDSKRLIKAMEENYLTGFKEVLRVNTDYLESGQSQLPKFTDQLSQACLESYLTKGNA